MGRITVFTSDGCSNSKRVVAGLTSRNIPHDTINISHYPAKRADMQALSMRLSTPQVFFNTRHVGGADETVVLLRDWDRSILAPVSSDGASLTSAGSNSSSSRSSGGPTRPNRPSRSISASPSTMNTRKGAVGSRKTRSQSPTAPKKYRGHQYKSILLRYEAEIGRFPNPNDARFDIPTGEPVPAEQGPQRPEQFCIALPTGVASSVLEMTTMLSEILEHKDNTKGSTTYKRSFLGKTLLQVFCHLFDITPKRAADFAWHLQQHSIIVSLTAKNDRKFYADALYRLYCYNTPDVLNSFRVWTERVDTDSIRLIATLCQHMIAVENAATDSRGAVNYKVARQSEDFAAFEEAVCELQRVDMANMTDSIRIAFGVNVYNLMTKYTGIKLGLYNGDSATSRGNFFSLIKFDIGGHLYNFSDWQHGILRGNAKAPHGFNPPFGKKDPRLEFCVKNPDCRIHFGLCCGARSCPPTQILSAENLEEELANLAAVFCEDASNLRIESEQKELHVSRKFSWYRSDFLTSSEQQLPQLLVNKFMSQGPKRQVLLRFIEGNQKAPKLVFLPYDWSTNESAGEFDVEALKPNKTEILRGVLRRGDSDSTESSTSPKKSPSKRRSPKQKTKLSRATPFTLAT